MLRLATAFALSLVVALASSVGNSAAQDALPSSSVPPGTFSSYYFPPFSYRVSIKYRGGSSIVFEVASGNFLEVQGSLQSNPDFQEEGKSRRPHTYRGEITIRIRNSAETVGFSEDTSMSDVMRDAPLEMKLHDVEVVVEPVVEGL